MINKFNYYMMQIIGRILRSHNNKKLRNRLKNKNVSIIASNCIGSFLCHDLGIGFKSPTVNLFFESVDFIKFVENLEAYLEKELYFYGNAEQGYPIGKLDDLYVHFVHYVDFEECVKAWERRKSRIVRDNIFIIHTDRDGCTDNIIERFDKISYNKILFSHLPSEKYSFIKYIPGWESDECVGELYKYCDYKGNRFYEKYFDIVSWLNQSN